MTVYIDGRPIPSCPRCGAHITRWNREELHDGTYPRILNTLECDNPACEWGTELERHLADLRPPQRNTT